MNVVTYGQSALTLGGFQHFHKAIDGFKEFKAVIGYLISDHSIIHIYFINETLIHQIIKVFLYLAIAHVGGVHYFSLAGAVFANSKHIGNYLYIGTPLAYRYFLTCGVAFNLLTI